MLYSYRIVEFRMKNIHNFSKHLNVWECNVVMAWNSVVRIFASNELYRIHLVCLFMANLRAFYPNEMKFAAVSSESKVGFFIPLGPLDGELEIHLRTNWLQSFVISAVCNFLFRIILQWIYHKLKWRYSTAYLLCSVICPI